MATSRNKKNEERKVHTLDREGLLTFGEHLLGEKRARFCLAGAGRLYVGQIQLAYDALAKPAPVREVSDAALEREALRAHDALGLGIWYGLASVAACPVFDVPVQEAAGRVKAAFGEKAPSPRWNAEARARRASQVRRDLEPRAADLAKLPPTPAGDRYEGWIRRWCDEGRGFVGRDAKGAAESSTEEAVALRTMRLSGLVSRARKALRDEVAFDASLPRDLEADVFGLFDRLLEDYKARVAATRSPRRRGDDAAPVPVGAPPAGPAPVSAGAPPAGPAPGATPAAAPVRAEQAPAPAEPAAPV
jgi:hypothetical protein